MCADTKITTQMKTNESKLFALEYKRNGCVTVFGVAANDFDVAKGAIHDCENAVNKLDRSTINMDVAREVIQSTLTEFYRDHILTRPSSNEVDFQLLIGVWLRAETALYKSSMTEILSEVDKYDAVGSGCYLAKYLIKQCGEYDNPTLDEVGLMASYAVGSTMDYDEYVGGEAEFLILKDDGNVEYSVPLYPSSSFPAALGCLSWKMLRDLAKVKDRGKLECQGVVDDYCQEVQKLNASERSLLDWSRGQRKSKGEAGRHGQCCSDRGFFAGG